MVRPRTETGRYSTCTGPAAAEPRRRREALRRVFPDAQTVWPHRDPNTVMGSWCSLMETGMALCNRDHDPRDIGRDRLGMAAEREGSLPPDPLP